MKVFHSAPFPDLVKPTTKRFVRLRTWEKWSAQGAQVKSRAADKYWYSTALFYLFNFRGGFTRPFARSVIHFWWDEIDKVMQHAASFLVWNLRCGYLDSLIYLDGIAIDNFAAETQRDFNSKRALAGSGRANDRDGRISHTSWTTNTEPRHVGVATGS